MIARPEIFPCDPCSRPFKSNDSDLAKRRRALELAKKRLNNLLNTPFSSNPTTPTDLSINSLKKKIKIFRKKKRV